MVINTNISSLTAQEASKNTGNSISSSLEKLSTGLKINKASDDASGLAIADKLRTQVTSINQGISNGNSAVSLLQIADKSMAEQSNILDTIKAKLIQANTDTTSADGRESIRKDISKLLEQLDNIAEQTNYNGNVLLQSASGSSAASKAASNALSFQIGESNNDIISNASIQSNTDGLGSKIEYTTANANTNISATNTATLASAGKITLNAQDASGVNTVEAVNLSGDVDTLALTTGMTITNTDTSNTDFTALLDAAVTTGKLSLSGGTYTVTTAGNGTDLDLTSVDDISANVTTAPPSSTPTTFTSQIGDVISTTGGTNSLTAGSDLAIALADTTKFDNMGGGNYKALTAGASLSVSAGESVGHSVATSVNIGTGSAYPAGSTITLNEDVIAGSDLSNELLNTAKFTLSSGTTGVSGAVYTVKDDFTTANLKVVDGESISLTKGANVTLPAATVTAPAMIDDANVKLDGVAVDWDSTNGTIVAQGAADGSAVLTAAGAKTLTFEVLATAATGQVFNAQAGDTVKITDDGTIGTALTASILESANWIDNGDSTYTAIAAAVIPFDDIGDKLEVTRTVGSTAAPVKVGGTDADIAVAAEATKVVIAGADVPVTFSTDTTVDVTNNGAAANTLTIAGDGTNALTNGGSDLSAITALKAGELTQELADLFQSIVDGAITSLNGYRGDIGSTQNQVESAVRNLMTQSTNISAAESIIRDVDYAEESANFNKQNIISQAGSYALSQANTVQQNVLKLLQ